MDRTHRLALIALSITMILTAAILSYAGLISPVVAIIPMIGGVVGAIVQGVMLEQDDN